ncbi:nuclear transport factor 2 family protein [Stutzerimonas nosocomialis]|uniref:Nuclear transport factor 2 family protein n=1 Tax=Stutzerimonas nosocomialis TaxID=1056496 RepID=A0A5R9R3L6_9GAMM|nr:nuclear transport factor 2 family protein [Stutzerimonas nosocomialis]TLX61054.1 nuclear transport factor 2 family protein [Stutzerimonas nosocomialis]TLX64925.1 nuclear transport factor 2 family protein [Stutzerimonas nosocomialis]
MTEPLPSPIATFFALSNGPAQPPLHPCFSTDAVVVDERRTHVGHDAISAWLDEARRLYRFQAEPLEQREQDGKVTVMARVSGTFPGSPARLRYVFHLNGDRIDRLEID